MTPDAGPLRYVQPVLILEPLLLPVGASRGHGARTARVFPVAAVYHVRLHLGGALNLTRCLAIVGRGDYFQGFTILNHLMNVFGHKSFSGLRFFFSP